jgi:hypothetical protein
LLIRLLYYLPRGNGNKFKHNDKRPTEKVYCRIRQRK